MPHATSQINGHGQTLLPVGVYAPLNTFYDASEELDLETFKKHALRIAQAGVSLVVNGSMGEAHHLTREERKLLIQTARQVLDDNQLTNIQLVAGTGGNSTKETIELSKDAAEAGAQFNMVIAPGYFAGALGPKALKTFFVDVAAASPIPVIIYNFPGAASGLDLSSDLIADIAAAAPNIIGVKLTCGSVGKLTRLVSLRKDFAVLGGFVDFLGPSLLLKSAGGITGLANVAPKSCLKLYNLTLSGLSGNLKDLAAATTLQELVSSGDWALQKGGISGTKYALQQVNGYGGKPRRPILEFEENGGDGKALMLELAPLVEYEKSL
ncbi:hypothetical protein BCR35DRAFT_274061 [Leucosporidium creatinivorum]|uniref:Dihydrodipicolinate synthetase n=1 Tax=Leucosporidium creatinivorum TaxID=106004 RepID=A0A1Y2G780_9BASI|nr:hypothetical protein BCR35DRAFT_274061 [Leucosporidium creatinivorum]